ncbi:glycosyltransferase [Pseudomonas chengduensis]|nr:glycosyltransferase [Pseudomonas chengduensis]MDH0622792.1 glycosyltransferase [Pseudomonas chengduensis]MDH1280480.1 glycosyltransferase [Pseudomonas chengduensis]MDH1665469.1 glycosyltransferase [Pseudomonas chengduensis]
MSHGQRIGCAIITYNRPESLLRLYASIPREQLDYFIIVNDGQPFPEFAGLQVDEFIQHESNQGVGRSKNDALRRMLERGVEHIFLIEDDIYLTDDSVFQRYIEAAKVSGIQHFNYSQHGRLNKVSAGRQANPNALAQYGEVDIAFYRYCVGAFSYYSRRCLETVGLMDEAFYNAWEHIDHSLRAIIAGFHPALHFFADIDESWRYFGEDEWSLAQSVIVSQGNYADVRKKAEALFYRKHHDFIVVSPPDFQQLHMSLESIMRSAGLLAEQEVFAERVALRSCELLDNLDETDRLRRWLERRKPASSQLPLIERTLAEAGGGPCFGIVVLDLAGDLAAVAETLKSLDADRNLYGNTRLAVLSTRQVPADYSSAELRFVHIEANSWVQSLNQLLLALPCDWLMLVRAGDEFVPAGLQTLALELVAAPGCAAVYGDALYRNAGKQLASAFRPGFNLDYLLSLPQVMSRHWLWRRERLLALDGFDPQFAAAVELDLILRLVEAGGMAEIGHVDEALLITEQPTLVDDAQEHAAVIRHLQARGYAEATLASIAPGRYRVRYGHSEQPLVSIVLLAQGRLEDMRACLESILERSSYPHYELLLGVPEETDAELQAWLRALADMGEARLRVVDAIVGENPAAVRNRLAGLAQGQYLLFLDPGVRITQADWLEGLLEHALRPEVGAVAPRLDYPSGEVRHAGIVLGLRGGAGGAFIGELSDAPGYLWRLQVAQNYSALSSACLLLARQTFVDVAGFSEEALDEQYRDVDLGLRLGQAGLLNVWTPHVRLPCWSVAGQGAATEQGKELLFERWLPQIARDPAYNQNLSLQAFGFVPDYRKTREWQAIGPATLPRILCHPSDASGCGQYRIRQPFQHMQEALLVDGAIIADHLPSAVELERLRPDVIVYQRQLGVQGLLQRQEGHLFKGAFRLADCDDYAFEVPEKSLLKSQVPQNIRDLFRVSLSMIDRLVVSTGPLAEVFAGLHPDIRVQPNYLPRAWWGALQSRRGAGRKPRVGWAGGSSHSGDLEMIAEVVRALADEVEWVFMGMCPQALQPYVHEFHPGVVIADYPRQLAALDLDLALAPLEDNLFNRCKTNLRQLEYGACGFPVICSDIDPFRDSGLPVTLVRNRTDDWLQAIRMHLADPDATAKAGDALREAVLRDWMLEGDNLARWRQAWLPD